MSGTSSLCGSYKVLRRKCIQSCVFAPYFCHKAEPTNFVAIHKVFGANNALKLLAHLSVSDCYGVVVTLSYEAQTRL